MNQAQSQLVPIEGRSSPPVPPMRVLLADDDLDLLEVLAESLRDDGHEVTEVHDGVELLRLTTREELRARHFDVVISDVLMPGVSGMGMLMQLNQADHPPPVILMTGLADPDLRSWAQQLGAVATFDKPFELDDLRTVLLNLQVDSTLLPRASPAPRSAPSLSHRPK